MMLWNNNAIQKQNKIKQAKFINVYNTDYSTLNDAIENRANVLEGTLNNCMEAVMF